MYFCEDTPLQDIERLMRRIPNFSPRGHGIVIVCSHEYSASDCDCRICSYYTGRGKKTGCSLERCTCMKERIESGAALKREIITETMSAIQYQPFLIRLEKYLKESEDSPMYAVDFGWDDHVRLRDTLSGIKGKFLLSYNDCPAVRELYEGFCGRQDNSQRYLRRRSAHNPYREDSGNTRRRSHIPSDRR